MTFGIKSILKIKTIFIVLIFIFLSKSIFLFFAELVFNSRFSFIEDCSEGTCVTITHNSKTSLNSGVKKYFYIGKGKLFPPFNREYVLFEDGAEFCFNKKGSDQYVIFSNIAEIENTIEDKVKVEVVSSLGSACLGKTY